MSLASKKKTRDIYGNWVWEESGDAGPDNTRVKNAVEAQSQESIHLDWRDYVALSIAALETFLLPVVVFMIILVVLAIVFVHI